MYYKSKNPKRNYGFRKISGFGVVSALVGITLLCSFNQEVSANTNTTNIHFDYVTVDELNEYDKTQIISQLPTTVTENANYYVVYRAISPVKNMLPKTGITDSIIYGFAGVSLLMFAVRLTKKNKKIITGIILLTGVGGTLTITSVSALTVKLLSEYHRSYTVSVGDPMPEGKINIDGYEWIGYIKGATYPVYVQSETTDLQLTIPNIVDAESDTNNTTSTLETTDLNTVDLLKLEKENDVSELILPTSKEEVLSETIFEETLIIDDDNSSDSQKTNVNKFENISPQNDSSEIATPLVENEISKHSQDGIDNVNKETNNSPISTLGNYSEERSYMVSEDSQQSDVETTNNIGVEEQSSEERTLEHSPETKNYALTSIEVSAHENNESEEPVATRTVTERIVRVTEELPFQVIYQEDINLLEGQTQVITEGTMGEKVSLQKIILHDGLEISREVTSENITKETTNRLVMIGRKKHYPSSETLLINNIENNDISTNLMSDKLPYQEIIYTELTPKTDSDIITDRALLEELAEAAQIKVPLADYSQEKLATTKLIEIYDNSIFEGKRLLENIYATYVTVSLKRKRNPYKIDEQTETLLSKDIPIFTSVIRIGTRKLGYETYKSDGSLVTISSALSDEQLEKIEIKNFADSVISESMPGYLGEAVDIEYTGDLSKTELGIEILAQKLKANSIPTIYLYDKETQLLNSLETVVKGNMVYAPITSPGTYLVADKHKQDSVYSTAPLAENKQTNKAGRSIVFILDSSGSMVDNDSTNKRIGLSKELIEQLDPKKDKVAIVDFDNSAYLHHKLSNDFEGAKEGLNRVDNNGGTYLLAGLNLGLKELLSDTSSNSKSIVFLTDGDDGSILSQYDDFIQSAVDNNISVFVVGLNSVNEVLLRGIANGTNGKYYYAEEANGLPEIFKQVEVATIAGDRNNDRISGYYSKEIFKGNLLSGTGEQLFEKQVEPFRIRLAHQNNILNYTRLTESEKQKLLNPLIDSMDPSLFEGILANDLDSDTLVNGFEARPEINKKTGKAYLYLVSHPNRNDTDRDGITDEKDNTPRGTNGAKLSTFSNINDTDGDGWSDADEANKKDSFGNALNPNKWNVDRRDLAIFASLAYLDNSDQSKFPISTIFPMANMKYSILNQLIDQKASTDNLYKVLNDYDLELFNRWEIVGEPLSENTKTKVNVTENGIIIKNPDLLETTSNLLIFRNKESRDIVLAFRGSDGVTELIKDLTIPFGNKSFANSVEELLAKFKTVIKNDYNNIYVTGHSLGGYQAYIAGSKLLAEGYPVVRISNFNGPGLPDWTLPNMDTEIKAFQTLLGYEVHIDIVPKLENKSYFDHLYTILKSQASKVVSFVTKGVEFAEKISKEITDKDRVVAHRDVDNFSNGTGQVFSHLGQFLDNFNPFNWGNSDENRNRFFENSLKFVSGTVARIGATAVAAPALALKALANYGGSNIIGKVSDSIWDLGTKHPNEPQKYDVVFSKNYVPTEHDLIPNLLYPHYMPSFFASKDFNQGNRTSVDKFL
ncbi:TPA: VWA domain-containing protein [Streptococcus suis]|nr:VWA domain-containing protein [Streptococcus suis]